jgi:hypothetical protein
LNIELKLATRSKNPARVNLAMPVVGAPVMLAEWKLSPDTSQRLVLRKGSLTPVNGLADNSGFSGIARAFRGGLAGRNIAMAMAALILVALAIAAWRWGSAPTVTKFSARFMIGLNVGLIAFLLAAIPLIALCDSVQSQSFALPRDITFVAPVQQANQAMTAEVVNVSDEFSIFHWIAYAWPAFFAPVLWGYAWLANKPSASVLAGRWWLGPPCVFRNGGSPSWLCSLSSSPGTPPGPPSASCGGHHGNKSSSHPRRRLRQEVQHLPQQR